MSKPDNMLDGQQRMNRGMFKASAETERGEGGLTLPTIAGKAKSTLANAGSNVLDDSVAKSGMP